MNNEIIFSWFSQPITGKVYCVSSGDVDLQSPVKFGFAQDIDKRLSQLQNGNPYTLYVLAAIPGNMECENKLHKELMPFNIRGEWYWPVEKVERIIKAMRRVETALRNHRHLIAKAIDEQAGDTIYHLREDIAHLDLAWSDLSVNNNRSEASAF